VAAIDQAPPERVVATLATAPLPVDPVAAGTSLKSASSVGAALRQATWTVIDPAMHLADARKDEADRLRKDVEDALCADQYVQALEPALDGAQATAAALLARTASPRPAPGGGGKPPQPGVKRIRREGLAPKAARELLDQLRDRPDVSVTVEWTEPEQR
jgi:hypothetical protein